MKPRFALRFSKIEELQKFAKEHGIKDPTATSRWRIDGVPSHTGAVGVVALLEQRGWHIEEVLYFADNHCVFTAEQVGDLSAMHYDQADGVRQQIHLKALDTKARSVRSTKSHDQKPLDRLKTSTNARTDFLRQAIANMPKAAAIAPASPKTIPQKRERLPSGTTPPPKESRMEVRHNSLALYGIHSQKFGRSLALVAIDLCAF